MAVFRRAAWSPWAMDQAMERLLATPKTTAVRPCRSGNMLAPGNEKGYQGRRLYTTESQRHGENLLGIQGLQVCLGKDKEQYIGPSRGGFCLRGIWRGSG